MKILCIAIANKAKSTGGHLHSLLNISRELAKDHNVKIISFGNESSELLDSSGLYIGYCSYKLLNIFRIRKQIKKIVGEFKPDVLNIYNEEIYLLFRLLILFTDAKLILTKCGGKNPIKSQWVFADNLIVFSKENYNWFISNKKYKKSNIFLLPNRVGVVEIPSEMNQKNKKDKNSFNFLRIGRISRSYINSYMKLIDLVAQLKKDNFLVRLFIIGTINDIQYYKQIKHKITLTGIDCTLITDENKVKIASKYLYLGDCVLGTGRSAMEAMSVSKPVLVPALNSPFPILLTKDNFELYFNMNFSERSFATVEDIRQNYDKIVSLIKDKNYRKKVEEDSLIIFNENFSVLELNKKYQSIFEKATNKRKFSLYNFIYLIYCLNPFKKSIINRKVNREEKN